MNTVRMGDPELPDQAGPPVVMGEPTRVGEVLFPTWVRVVGGPADILNEQDWTIVAYIDVVQNNIEAAKKLAERAALAPGAEWRVESLGEETVTTSSAPRAGRVYVV